MLENRDPAIKLFGMEIPVSSGDGKADSGGEVVPAEVDTDDESEKEPVMKKVNEIAQQDDTETSRDEEATNSEAPPESNANPKTPSIHEESSKSKVSDPEKDSNEANTSQEKTLKKPDKILPCPRCNSMDTKFCYYNNYNVNQPRHFCKACQRYWTAGGTMRNVPVGAGRRKSKNSASSNYRHITISEALQAAQIDVPDKSTHPAFTSNGGVLNFGYDAPICESMASMLNLADNKVLNGTSNGFHNFHGVPIPGRGGENGDNGSNGSSVTVSNSMEGGKNPQEPVVRNINGFPAQMPPLSGPGILWPYPWTPALPPPVFCPPGYPMPFHPAAYWNCSVPTPWNPSWLSPQSASNQQCPISGPSSPLGKHSRDGKMLKPDGSEEEEQPQPKSTNARVLVPKTLRIDDPAEAAKSSIWETLGIENESISGGRMFKGFQSKKDEKNNAAKPSPVLLANPAALSRSLNFQEGI